MGGRMTKAPNPFRWFDSSPEVIRLVVMMYVRYPLSLRNVEDLLFERGIDICHETVRLWCWGGRPPTASMCQTEVVADLRQGDRPWNSLPASGWIRRSTFSSCMA